MVAVFIKNIFKINFKTLIINFKYLPFTQAIYLPIFVSRKCNLLVLKGEIKIEGKISPGLVQIGYGKIGIFDKRYSRSVLEIKGKITFKGKARIGQGSKLSVGSKGHMILGNNLLVTAESSIVSHKKISIGDDVLISWDVLIMDTDFHSIYTENGEKINPNKDIVIGDRVWIGCRCLILKGSEIPNKSVIAANTVYSTNKLKENNSIIGGIPVRVIKERVTWEI
ncbi:hypothetical protein Celal_1577 [Cellulophaga algicola DSM 14237]|uniref:Transferase hexapeptide repeat containing protein n=1 Tax=Cellulophaga algicola (strain DSM 14237 / IC166 / ACAM 630) TaxID=688270 RepID=E6XB32_CELAD|nr:acyltransferase [Cellulophaga algicola]ADV48888.1 hypothetical protein Celal_1577 [Cellulophaga algicola DSM 14237]